MRFFVRCLTIAAAAAAVLSTGCSSGSDDSVRTYPMGKPAQVGGLAYNVYESHWMTQLGEAPATRVPEHRFFVIRLSVTNHGDAEAMVPPMTVENDKGQTFLELSNGDQVPQWMGLLRQLRPGASIQGTVVFDCPPGGYLLRVTDETETRAAKVDIPLTYTAETPEIPSPAIPEKK